MTHTKSADTWSSKVYALNDQIYFFSSSNRLVLPLSAPQCSFFSSDGHNQWTRRTIKLKAPQRRYSPAAFSHTAWWAWRPWVEAPDKKALQKLCFKTSGQEKMHTFLPSLILPTYLRFCLCWQTHLDSSAVKTQFDFSYIKPNKEYILWDHCPVEDPSPIGYPGSSRVSLAPRPHPEEKLNEHIMYVYIIKSSNHLYFHIGIYKCTLGWHLCAVSTLVVLVEAEKKNHMTHLQSWTVAAVIMAQRL